MRNHNTGGERIKEGVMGDESEFRPISIALNHLTPRHRVESSSKYSTFFIIIYKTGVILSECHIIHVVGN